MTDPNNPYGLPPASSGNPYAAQGGYAPPAPPQAPGPYANPYNQQPQGGYGQPGAAPGQGFNPYAPPSVDAQTPAWAQDYDMGQVLATPGTRLVAQLLDGLLLVGACLPAIIGAIAESPELAIGLGVLGYLGLSIYQWYLLATTGQTLGKKWMGVRVVKYADGGPVDFVSAVVLRLWVIGLASAFISIVGLIDVLFIFSSEHRCLHDHIAGTKVIVA